MRQRQLIRWKRTQKTLHFVGSVLLKQPFQPDVGINEIHRHWGVVMRFQASISSPDVQVERGSMRAHIAQCTGPILLERPGWSGRLLAQQLHDIVSHTHLEFG